MGKLANGLKAFIGANLGEMKLLKASDRKALPELYAQDGKGLNAKVYVKFFNSRGRGTWFATEFDGDNTFFGYTMGLGGDELGYFTLKDMQRGGIERDMSFKPQTLKSAIAAQKKLPGE